ncbi:hypothetical protein PR202_gb19745 [Eleusine coracana subsp. coracana]|uniref:NAC domain-containing protein n=1 Tax=Eleusine coracana subsp. coracana TaxID=191504 RepID=A0AAV5F8Q8_ELECO|nr:hypothetical protein PR202_gb19745 [Eleusine coracana subsp. coracana]
MESGDEVAIDHGCHFDGSARFYQRAHQLVDDLLRPRIAGRPVSSARFHVHDADAYSATPHELAIEHAPAPGPRPTWFFLTPPHYHGDRRCRSVGCAGAGKGDEGYWMMQNGHTYNKHVEVEDDGGLYLYVRNYVYVDTTSPAVTRPDPEWVMMEYGIARGVCSRQELVLCEMYRAKGRKARP